MTIILCFIEEDKRGSSQQNEKMKAENFQLYSTNETQQFRVKVHRKMTEWKMNVMDCLYFTVTSVSYFFKGKFVIEFAVNIIFRFSIYTDINQSDINSVMRTCLCMFRKILILCWELKCACSRKYLVFLKVLFLV